MQKNGYDQFFKTAQQLRNGQNTQAKRPKPKAPRLNIQTSGKSTEELFKEAFSQNLKNNKVKSKKKKHQPMPWKFILVLSVLTTLAGIGVYDPEIYEKTISKIDVGFIGSSFAQTNEKKAEKSSSAKDESAAKSAQTESAQTDAQGPQKKNWTDEEVSYFSKLSERKLELDNREQELAKLEEELQKQRVEIESRIVELQKVRDQISGILNDKVNIDQTKINRLVEFYSNMKPQQAAKIIGNIDEDLAVEILGQMKKKNAADIMNLLEAEKAQNLSEKFAGYKRR